MNRGGGGGQSNFNNGGNSNPNNLAQMTADLNNLGLDPNTMKKLSMSGLREFIPPSTGGSSVNSVTSSMNMRSTDNSGSNSPYQQQQQPNFVQNPSSVSGQRPQDCNLLRLSNLQHRPWVHISVVLEVVLHLPP